MSYNRDSDDALSKPLRVYAERDKIKRFDAQGNANVAGAYCFYADAEACIVELEAKLKTAHFAVIELSRAYSDWPMQVSDEAEEVITGLIEAIESGDTSGEQ